MSSNDIVKNFNYSFVKLYVGNEFGVRITGVVVKRNHELCEYTWILTHTKFSCSFLDIEEMHTNI